MTFASLYLIGLFICIGEAVLQVTISLGKVELSVGESKFFTCTAIGEPVSIEWYSPDGEKVISNERVVVQTEGVRSRLTIYNANEEDAGIYQCQVTDASGNSQEATVLVEIYKKLTFHDITSPQEFREGEDAEVICQVSSSPAPMITWLHNNQDVTAVLRDNFMMVGDSNLKIRRISKKHEGVYRCEGRVEARGEIDFRDITVIVNVPPIIHVPVRSANATADRQESVTLMCTATGSPEPDITWYRNGRLVENNDKYLMKKSTELTIRDIGREDTGPYSCRAVNKAGSVEEQLFLKVFVQPRITSLENKTATENGRVEITCDAEGDPIPTIFWSRSGNGSNFLEGEKIRNERLEVQSQNGKSSLHIRNIEPSDSGAYHCEAISPIGRDRKSMHLDIQYAPKFLSTQVTYYSWEGNSVNISCDVTANPQPSIHWRKEGVVLSDLNTSAVSIYKKGTKILLEITPAVDSDFGSYNCTASNQIGTRFQEFTLVQAAVPSRPYGLRVLAASQTIARISFTKPDSHGGVPIHHYQVEVKQADSEDWKSVNSNGTQTQVILTNLKPNSTYHFRVAAVNGKGQGKHSQMETFQTLPVQEPGPPAVQGYKGSGKNFKLVVTKQDDGGSPILRYVLKYRTKDKEEEWVQKVTQGGQDSIILEQLQWDMQYQVQITAVNKLGSSEPTFYEFTMPPKPNTIANTLFRSLGLGAVIGLAVAALLLILVITDISCFFMKQCGVLMCIATRICGKKNSSSTKAKEAEEGKAAYLKDGSKEPIVEMRTEDEPITNHDGSSANEPNETTPLTEPEKLPLKEGNGKESLSPENMEEAVPNDIIQPKEDCTKA
ncbi:neural cell adhesion molecule 2-like isoform X1 [Pristis pectinata]|uniref:neural cell adhesion molecule 2-like isoform X1 n=1 Tax=Pristis pectinata TaxID=685728 RepID=UPI00223CCE58|nr:neural cell adhesion molecule 2-like isoform X1 [Pristis pectinata]